MSGKNIYIIAGPNGSGKTTFAKRFLPNYADCTHFINAELIAQGLSPFSPVVAAMKAGRIVLKEIGDFSNRGVSFAFETTLSGKTYLTLLKKLKAKGYLIHLFFLWIPSPSLALERIKDRVRSGGHHVPAADVKRRFGRSVKNFFGPYQSLLDSWMLFDNSQAASLLVAERAGSRLKVYDTTMCAVMARGMENAK
jgi:predicted ABC-type ATPase